MDDSLGICILAGLFVFLSFVFFCQLFFFNFFLKENKNRHRRERVNLRVYSAFQLAPLIFNPSLFSL